MANKKIVEKLKQMLKELFQFENNDLDFGIYRILNIKRKEISDFIERELFEIIEEELRTVENIDLADNQKEVIINEYEEDMYNDIINFFSRYYDNGDFITKRRYSKRNKYTIPYNGEEVFLFWANSDQYYIKTTENFKNYSFKLGNIKVSFKILNDEANLENNDVKDNDIKFFIFNDIIKSNGNHINIGFGYRGLTPEEEELIKKETKKKSFKKEYVNQYNIRRIQERIEVSSIEALKKKHQNLNGEFSERSELEWHLNKFTTKNSSDYFIHKNLKQFLEQELDFFIKNELITIDELISYEIFRNNFRKINIFKKVSLKIIDFLTQIENFQKKLWEKPKFVIKTDYCITLDYIDKKYYSEIINNQEQIEEWKRIFSFDLNEEIKKYSSNLLKYASNSEIDILERNNTLLVDTKFFDSEFKFKILNNFDNIEERVTGILIKSDNFHALNLLVNKYKDKITCCYIDPPYNTDATPILYKNDYKDSSWLSLMETRLTLSKNLLENEIGVISIAIDDNELANLCLLLERIFPNYEIQKSIIIHYPGSGTGRKNISRTHEYNLYVIPKKQDILKGQLKEGGKRKRSFRRAGTGENNYRIGRPNSFYALLVEPETKEIIGIEDPPNDTYPLSDTPEGYKRIYPIGSDGSERVWTLSYEGAIDALKHGIIECSDNFTINRIYDDEDKRNLLDSVWSNRKFNATTYGTNLLTSIFGVSGLFSYPKSLYTVMTAIDSITFNNNDSLILDFFAGSGTTGHAVLKINKTDNGKRKFILIEMGKYFETVLKQRILKVIYSDNWKEGKPQDINGSKKQIIKYQSLEQYDDSLNNVEFAKPNILALKSKEYKIKYMLNFETKMSNVFLNIDLLDNPFEYKLEIEEYNQIKTTNIDLIETFNYLAGIFVNKIIKKQNNSVDYIIVKGNREEKNVIVIWRNKNNSFDPKQDKEFVEKNIIADDEYDEIFVNGSSLIENAISLDVIFKKSMLGE